MGHMTDSADYMDEINDNDATIINLTDTEAASNIKYPKNLSMALETKLKL